MKIEGASVLFTDTRAIGADWRFVAEELNIAVNPFRYVYTGDKIIFASDRDRVQALVLGTGLGVAVLPKTLFKIASDKESVFTIYKYFKKSNEGVDNGPIKNTSKK